MNQTLAKMASVDDGLSEETLRLAIVAAFAHLSDRHISQAYQSAAEEKGAPIADLLAIVGEERGLVL